MFSWHKLAAHTDIKTSSMVKITSLRMPGFMNFFFCHSQYGGFTKFQVRMHGSQVTAVENWMKLYSTTWLEHCSLGTAYAHSYPCYLRGVRVLPRMIYDMIWHDLRRSRACWYYLAFFLNIFSSLPRTKTNQVFSSVRLKDVCSTYPHAARFNIIQLPIHSRHQNGGCCMT
jgi:hypothetical protein